MGKEPDQHLMEHPQKSEGRFENPLNIRTQLEGYSRLYKLRIPLVGG
jgi:hypothetical protein